MFAGVPVSDPSSALPRRGNAVSRAFGRLLLLLLGNWRVTGAMPDAPKIVFAVAPHTSNLDFLVGIGAMFTLGLRIHWLGKDTLFRPPLGALMRWLGGTPVKRSASQNAVAQVVAAFDAHEQFLLGLSPEGTRGRTEQWRTGFYHIARGAGALIVPVALDYGARQVRLFAALRPTGNESADLAVLRARFVPGMARFPERY